jgi:hypothetical protein
MILLMLKPRSSHASLIILPALALSSQVGNCAQRQRIAAMFHLNYIQAPGRTHRTMSPLALEAPYRRWVPGDSIKEKVPLERPSGLG